MEKVSLGGSALPQTLRDPPKTQLQLHQGLFTGFHTGSFSRGGGTFVCGKVDQLQP